MSLDRDIAFAAPSTLSRTADSEFDGIDLGGHAEAAFDLVEVAGITVQPLASFRYAHLQQDAFEETGAGSLSLSADEEEIDSLVSGLGARLHALVDLGDGFSIRPELRGGWLHEFGDRERKLEARIGGVPGVSYSVRGTELPRDSGTLGLGWIVSNRGRLHVFAEYDLGINSDLLQHSASIGFALLW
jgi:outer membrane autotransporter protein